jgi:DNA-binding PucR family transcriptional regulator
VVPDTQVRRTLDAEDQAAAREAFSDLVPTSESIGDGMATYRARRFVRHELGPLAVHTDSSARLRSTLLGFLAHGCSHVRAAPDLHMHQNTFYNHVRRAEELLGGSVSERRVELQAALILAETLGPDVLPAA